MQLRKFGLTPNYNLAQYGFVPGRPFAIRHPTLRWYQVMLPAMVNGIQLSALKSKIKSDYNGQTDRGLCEFIDFVLLGVKDYRCTRECGEAIDEPMYSFPNDGIFKLVTPQERSSKIRYEAGSKDEEWIAEKAFNFRVREVLNALDIMLPSYVISIILDKLTGKTTVKEGGFITSISIPVRLSAPLASSSQLSSIAISATKQTDTNTSRASQPFSFWNQTSPIATSSLATVAATDSGIETQLQITGKL